jgi:alpha-glucosidase
VWDETIVLPESRIGRLSAFARRKGALWMLAIMAGGEGATLELPLGFLGEGAYHASVVRDVPGNPADAMLEELTVRRGAKLVVTLERGGGYVARFRPTASAP